MERPLARTYTFMIQNHIPEDFRPNSLPLGDALHNSLDVVGPGHSLDPTQRDWLRNKNTLQTRR